MTKMMCIKQGPWHDMLMRPIEYSAPAYREIVTVEGEYLAPNSSEQVYLAEYNDIARNGQRVSFAKRWFVPLLDPKEEFDFRSRMKPRTKQKEPEHEDA